MPSLAEVRAGTGTVDVYRELGSKRPGMEKFHWKIVYRLVIPETIDQELERALAARADDDLPEAEADDATRTNWAQFFVDNVVSHDLSVEPDGPPIPVTVEDIRRDIYTEMIVDALLAIASAKRPNRSARRG